MAVIVAFGDSNTWGYDPASGTRFAAETRWTGVMAAALGAGHQGDRGRAQRPHDGVRRSDRAEPPRRSTICRRACSATRRSISSSSRSAATI